LANAAKRTISGSIRGGMDWTPGLRIPYPGPMDIRATALPEVKVLIPRRHGDARGFFCETWSAARMAAAGLDIAFVQDNEGRSARAGTLRGLHYQSPPFAQAKLVRVAGGAILDVAVDARRGSPTYGRWVAEELSAANGAQMLVPRGYLHGYLTFTDDTLVL
jgi:dTDP-4-dehydrorhamnose 3,5-epimerase